MLGVKPEFKIHVLKICWLLVVVLVSVVHHPYNWFRCSLSTAGPAGSILYIRAAQSDVLHGRHHPAPHWLRSSEPTERSGTHKPLIYYLIHVAIFDKADVKRHFEHCWTHLCLQGQSKTFETFKVQITFFSHRDSHLILVRCSKGLACSTALSASSWWHHMGAGKAAAAPWRCCGPMEWVWTKRTAWPGPRGAPFCPCADLTSC